MKLRVNQFFQFLHASYQQAAHICQSAIELVCSLRGLSVAGLGMLLLFPLLLRAQETSPPQSQSVVTTSAFESASPCSELLRAGIYNRFKQQVSNTTASQIQTEICMAYSSYKRDLISGGAKAEYKLFGGSVSYSREQLEVIGQITCGASNSQFYDRSDLAIAAETISEAAIIGYTECSKLYAAGLRSKTEFREEDEGQITLEIAYVAPTGTVAATTITGLEVSPANSWTCNGPLLNLIGKANALGTQSTGLSCTRKVSTTPFTKGTQKHLAEASTITLFTDVGMVNRRFSAIVFDDQPPPPVLPIGSIIPFAGTIADLAQMRMQGWYVCDGQVVNDATAAEQFRGKATPNLTNRFLRGVATPDKMAEIGGSEVHKHWFSARSTYEMEGTLNGPEGADNYTGKPNWNHKHDVDGFTNDQYHLPPYFTVVYLIKVK